MIVRTIQIGATAFFGIAFSLGVVSAQSAASAENDALTESGSGSTEQATSKKSTSELVASARIAVDTMETSADNMSRMLRAAREDKDVIKVLCLDDKLSQMNVATRSAGDRLKGLEAAVSSGNEDRARHDSAVLDALTDRGTELGAEANECIGKEQGVIGGSTLEVKIDPEIPSNLGNGLPVLTTVPTAPPAADVTSPTKSSIFDTDVLTPPTAASPTT